MTIALTLLGWEETFGWEGRDITLNPDEYIHQRSLPSLDFLIGLLSV